MHTLKRKHTKNCLFTMTILDHTLLPPTTIYAIPPSRPSQWASTWRAGRCSRCAPSSQADSSQHSFPKMDREGQRQTQATLRSHCFTKQLAQAPEQTHRKEVCVSLESVVPRWWWDNPEALGYWWCCCPAGRWHAGWAWSGSPQRYLQGEEKDMMISERKK